jgi:uncharacterized spore protein YtfJ
VDPPKLIEAARDAVSARRVFGDPVEREGVTLVPAATVLGGGGGGSNEGNEAAGGGAGIGYGLIAWPSGAYEIKDGSARWIPALDTTRIAVVVLIVIAILLRRSN